MKKNYLFLFVLVFHLSAAAQGSGYNDSLQSFRDNYIKEHGVVKDKDQTYLRFFPVDKKYVVTSGFQRIYDASWFKMETSGKEKKVFRVYGILSFKMDNSAYTLQVYQSQDLLSNPEYSKYLFLPFTDKTCGEESYENGRYIDLTIAELEKENYIIDFNKAYNPYCAYISGQYNCPVPPKENDLPVWIKAGEMKFGKIH